MELEEMELEEILGNGADFVDTIKQICIESGGFSAVCDYAIKRINHPQDIFPAMNMIILSVNKVYNIVHEFFNIKNIKSLEEIEDERFRGIILGIGQIFAEDLKKNRVLERMLEKMNSVSTPEA